ncbi:CLUMA_CG017856, isoform B [Clunio marinus]|nr:CLUMA_CG017856, isoform B [Clunio marinus]
MLSIFTFSLLYVLNSRDKLGQTQPIVAMGLMALISILAIPIFGLTGFHMVLVSRGRTTNEQVTGKFKGGYNPFSRGCWNNCCFTLCGPQYPSLKDAKKHGARRINQNNQQISIITSENTGLNSNNHQPQMQAQQQQQHYDGRINTQVKTYTDHGNGHSVMRTGNSSHYSKLSPGREHDIDMDPQASQSQDCEPTPPPLQRHGSKNNFFPPPMDNNEATRQQNVRMYGQARFSPHPRHRSYTSDPLSPDQTMSVQQMQQTNVPRMGTGNLTTSSATPTMQQRIKAIGGVALPLAAVSSPVRRSNPGTPTQVRRPDFIYVANQQQQQQQQQPGLNYYDFPIHQQTSNQMMIHQQQQQGQIGLPSYPNGSPQRRFLSEGELLSRTASNGLSIGNELQYVNRTNNTVDNIRELAGSPQRGVYNWKDNSPPGYPNQNQIPMGAAMYANVAALEMANSIEMTNTNYQQQAQQQQQQGEPIDKSSNEMNPNVQQSQQIVDRGSIYDTNYEISV